MSIRILQELVKRVETAITSVETKINSLIAVQPELDEEYLEHGENAPITISFEHHMIHEGYHYIATFSATLGAAATLRILFVTPASTVADIHLFYEASNGLGGTWILYEDTTTTADGTVMTAVNSKRASTNTANLKIYHTPNVTSPGTALTTFIAGAGNRGGGEDKRDNEIILKPNTKYMLQFTADGNNTPAAANLLWYELLG